MNISIVPFTETDLVATDETVRLAYNVPGSRKEPLQRYLTLQPDGAFVAKEHGNIVGFAAALDYGAFAYIGLMSVHPARQKQGIGHRLMEQLLTWLEMRNCPTVLLDATPVGFPLYQQFGFSEDDTTVVLRSAQPTLLPPQRSDEVSVLREEELLALIAFDAPYFGTTRSGVLTSYRADDPERVLVAHGATGQLIAYLIAQPRVLGPWVAHNFKAAEQLLQCALTLPLEREISVFVSAHNYDALHLLERYGFKIQRTLSHMRRGKAVLRARHTMLYGQTSLGLG